MNRTEARLIAAMFATLFVGFFGTAILVARSEAAVIPQPCINEPPPKFKAVLPSGIEIYATGFTYDTATNKMHIHAPPQSNRIFCNSF